MNAALIVLCLVRFDILLEGERVDLPTAIDDMELSGSRVNDVRCEVPRTDESKLG